MARNWTIFGPNRSRRRELNFEKFSNERASEETNKTNKKNRKFFENFFKKFSKNLVRLEDKLVYFLAVKTGSHAGVYG